MTHRITFLYGLYISVNQIKYFIIDLLRAQRTTERLLSEEPIITELQIS
jgi:hypothetical protein